MSDDVNFDDWDDNDLNFDDFGGESTSPEEGSREVISALPGSFVDGVKSTVTDTRFVTNALKETLPGGYGKAMDQADEIATRVETTYRETMNEIRPAVNEFKKASKQHLPKIQKLLPDSIYQKLDKALTVEERSSGPTVEQQRNDQVGMELSRIFQVQNAAREEERGEERYDKIMSEENTKSRHEANMTATDITNKSIQRLVSYQDTITSEYQKKHLDLTFRQYFALTDLLEVTKAGFTDQATSLKAITHNTALPEAQKQLMSETYQQLTRERLLGAANEKVSKKLRGITGNMFNSLANTAKEKAREFGDNLSDFGGLLDQLSMMDDMGGEMGGSNASMAAEMGGSLAGSAFAQRLVRMGGGKLAKWLRGNDTVMKGNAKLNYFFNNRDRILNEFAKSSTDDYGLKGRVLDFFKESIQTVSGENNTVLSNLKTNATDKVDFDLITRRTIIEIIPDYLSRILQQATITNTGDQSTERIVYNADKEMMTSLSDAVADADERFLGKDEISEVGKQVDTVVSELDDKGQLSDEARKVLGMELLKKSEYGLFDPRDLTDSSGFSVDVSPEVEEEIKALMMERYKITEAGIDDEGNEIKAGVAEDRETWERLNKDSSLMNGLSRSIGETQDKINEQVGLGNKELLRRAGIITKDENGVDKFNYDQYWGRFADEVNRPKEVETEEGTTEAISEEDTKPAPGMVKSFFEKFALGITDEDREELAKMQEQKEGFKEKYVGSYSGHTRKASAKDFTESVQMDTSSLEDAFSGVEKAVGSVGSDVGKILSYVKGRKTEKPKDEKTKDVYSEILNKISSDVEAILTESTEIKRRTGTILYDPEGNALVDPSSIAGMGGSMVKGVGRIGGTLGRALGSYYTKVGGMAMTGGRFALDKVSKGGKMIADGLFKKEEGDILVAGMKVPRIRFADLKAGQYKDKATGKIITTWEELKEATEGVTDLAGNTLLDAADFAKGLTLADGRNLVTKGWNWVKDNPVEWTKSYFKGVGKLAGKGLNAAKSAYEALERKGNELKDVYIRGFPDDPVMTKQGMRMGIYFDAESGKPILSFKDIKGPIKDRNGDIIIREEDLKAGLVDDQGNDIEFKSIPDKILEYGMSGIMFAGRMGKKGMDKLKDLAGGAFDRASGLFGRIVGWFEDTAGNLFANTIDAETLTINAQVANLHSSDEVVEVFKATTKSMKDAAEDLSEASTVKVEAAAEATQSETLVERGKREVQQVSKMLDESETVQRTKEKLSEAGDMIVDKAEQAKSALHEKAESAASAMETFSNRTTEENVEKLKGVVESAKDVASGKLNNAVDMAKENETVKRVQDAAAGQVDKLKDSKAGKAATENFSKIKEAFQADNGKVSVKGVFGKLGDKAKDKFKDKFKGKDKDESAEAEKRQDSRFDKLTSSFTSGMDKLKTAVTGITTTKLTMGSPELEAGLDEVKSSVDTMSDEVTDKLPEPEKEVRAGSYLDQRNQDEEAKQQSFYDRYVLGKEKAEHEAEREGLTGGMWDKAKDYGKGLAGKAWNRLKKSKLGRGVAAVGTGLKAGAAFLGKGALSLAGKALGGLGSMAWAGAKAALPFLGKGLMAVGRVALGPVGAALTGAYLGYKAVKYLADGSSTEPLETVRFAQYGIDPASSQQLRAIRRWEDELYDYVAYDEQGNAEIDMDTDDFEDLMEEYSEDYFGFDGMTDTEAFDNFMNWYTHRFYPTFCAHASAAYQIDEDIDLLDIDDEMDDEDKPKFFRTLKKFGSERLDSSKQYTPFVGGEFFSGLNDVYDSVGKELGVDDASLESAEKEAVKKDEATVKERKEKNAEKRKEKEKAKGVMVGNGLIPKTPKAPTVDSKNAQAPGNTKAAEAKVSAATDLTGPTAVTAVESTIPSVTPPSESMVTEELLKPTVEPESSAETLKRTAYETPEEETSEDVITAIEEVKADKAVKINHQQTHLNNLQQQNSKRMVAVLEESLMTQKSMDLTLQEISLKMDTLTEEKEDTSFFGSSSSDDEERKKRKESIKVEIEKLRKRTFNQPAQTKGSVVSMKRVPDASMKG